MTDDNKFSKLFGSVFDHRLQFVSSHEYNSSVIEDLCVLPLSARELSTAKNLYGNIDKAIMANGNYTKVIFFYLLFLRDQHSGARFDLFVQRCAIVTFLKINFGWFR